MAVSRGGSTDPFVGRDRELVRSESLLLDALAGHGRVVLCTGEAGIGKTRLAEELASSAADHGAVVVWARSTDPGSSPPYGLWRLVVDELVSSTSEALPELSQLGRLMERPTSAVGLESGSSQRFGLFAMLRTALRQCASYTGLVLVLDDVHWADEGSRVLLTDVARHLRGTRILIFATSRTPGDSEDELPILAADSDVQRMNLTGLPRDAVSELLSGLAATPDRIEWVLERTGGNPFLVRELAQLVVESGSAMTSVPGRVVDATTYRVRQLSDPARSLLRAAAIAGNGFSIGVVAKMLGRPLLALLDLLDECRGAGFLVSGDRRGDYRFSHALIRSAVVAQLGEVDRRQLHAAAADAIEELFAGQLGPRLAEIAGHRVEASLPGERESAVAACAAAADAAKEMLAYEEAVRLYREALVVGGPELDPGVRVDLELGLASALYSSGDLPGWRAVASEVGRRAERGQDWTSLAQAALVLEATGEPEWDIELCRMCEVALDSQ